MRIDHVIKSIGQVCFGWVLVSLVIGLSPVHADNRAAMASMAAAAASNPNPLPLIDGSQTSLLQQLSTPKSAARSASDAVPSSNVPELPALGVSPIEKQYDQDSELTLYSIKIDESESATESQSVKKAPPEKKAVEQYGYNFFTNSGGSMSAYANAPANPDYILAPTDALLIRVWGKIEEQFSVTIDNNGQIFLPKVGVISVAGVSYGQVCGVIKRELGKYYANFQVSVTMGSMRNIKVFVLGDVRKPGAYDVPAKSTLMAALYSSGGPLKTGSMRKIQLIRNKHTVKTIDLYDYLQTGDQSQDPVLQNFDTIFVPLIGNTVKVDGVVKRPGIFEFNGDETLYDAIQVFGGGGGIAYYGKRVQVERVLEGQKRIMVDVDFNDPSKFKAGLKNEKLKNGDVITVFPILPKRYNEVVIQGNVTRPGSYEFSSGMTLGDLIRKSDGVLKDTFLQRIEIYRVKSDTEKSILAVDYTNSASAKIKLNEFDIVHVYSKEGVDGRPVVSVTGPVDHPGEFRLLEGMRVLDLAYLGKLQPEAEAEQAELVRRNPDGSQVVYKVNLSALRQSPDSEDNRLLIARDQLFLRADSSKLESMQVTVSGQVKYPGIYVVRRGDRLVDVIKRAGGLTEKAFLPGLVFNRASVLQQQQDAQKYILAEEKRRLLFDADRIKSLQSQEYREAYTQSLTALQATFNETNLSGRIVLDFNSLSDLSPEYNLELKDKDSIYIPETPTSVQISGGIQNAGAQIYTPGRDAAFYIQRCGGYTKFARASDIYVVRASGRVVRDGGESIPIAPGDTIYVQEEIKVSFDWVGGIFEFSKFLVNVLTGIAIINGLN